MPEMLFVKAVEGALVRDPETKVRIPDEGALVPSTGYWLKRIRTGDVVVATPPPTQKSEE